MKKIIKLLFAFFLLSTTTTTHAMILKEIPLLSSNPQQYNTIEDMQLDLAEKGLSAQMVGDTIMAAIQQIDVLIKKLKSRNPNPSKCSKLKQAVRQTISFISQAIHKHPVLINFGELTLEDLEGACQTFKQDCSSHATAQKLIDDLRQLKHLYKQLLTDIQELVNDPNPWDRKMVVFMAILTLFYVIEQLCSDTGIFFWTK